MKIMICIGQLCKGGAERVVSNLSNYLSNNNDVTLVIFRKTKIEYKIDNNVKVIELDEKEKTKFKIIRNINRFIKLNKIIKKGKYDITLSFLPKPSYIVLLLKKIRKNKVIVSVRNDPKIEYKSLLNKILMKWLYPTADGFVFQTNEAKNYFSSKIQNKSEIILNSINQDFLVDKPFDGVRDKVIVSVGRLEQQKNQLLLIKAFGLINKKFPDYKLIIYGDGSLKAKLEKEIFKLNLTKFIELPGVENNIKSKIYKASLFVLSSDYEGLPNSLIEAMVLGVPCISTNCPCGGPKELIDDEKNGFLTEVNNVKMLAEKIEAILSGKFDLQKISINANNLKYKINPIIINKQWEDYIKSFV